MAEAKKDAELVAWTEWEAAWLGKDEQTGHYTAEDIRYLEKAVESVERRIANLNEFGLAGNNRALAVASFLFTLVAGLMAALLTWQGAGVKPVPVPVFWAGWVAVVQLCVAGGLCVQAAFPSDAAVIGGSPGLWRKSSPNAVPFYVSALLALLVAQGRSVEVVRASNHSTNRRFMLAARLASLTPLVAGLVFAVVTALAA